MRFKVGDKVRVKSDIKDGKIFSNGLVFFGKMNEVIGHVVTIREVLEPAGTYWVDGFSDAYSWCDEMFEPVDSPIHSDTADTDLPMTAVEVLNWFRNASAALMEHLFDGWNDTDFILGQYSSEEIVQKISAYEATKKSPVPAKEPTKSSDSILPGEDAALKRIGDLSHELCKYAATPAAIRMDEDAVYKMQLWTEEIEMQLDIIDWAKEAWE